MFIATAITELSSHLLPRGIFCFSFFFFVYPISKNVGKNVGKVDKLEMKGPEKQTHKQKWLKWKNKRGRSTLSFLKGLDLDVQLERS